MSPRVLIVDDELEILNLIKLILKPYAHCATARDGSEAVLKYSSAFNQGQPFDLIILDVMMPSMSGLMALKRIRGMEKERSIKETDGIKVMMLTASDDTPDVLEAFSCRCDAYIIKPFEGEELIAELRKMQLLDDSIQP